MVHLTELIESTVVALGYEMVDLERSGGGMLRVVWLGLIAAILGGGAALADPAPDAPRVTIDTGALAAGFVK